MPISGLIALAIIFFPLIGSPCHLSYLLIGKKWSVLSLGTHCLCSYNNFVVYVHFVQILSSVLEMVPSLTAIRLAVLAAQKELVDLEKWLSGNLSTYKDFFFEVIPVVLRCQDMACWWSWTPIKYKL